MFGVERINRTRKLTPAATEALHSARPAKDATIAPGEHVGLIVDIRVGGDNASMGPTRVNYTSDGESHYWTGGTDLRLAAGGCGA
jgi:hypothetical protein